MSHTPHSTANPSPVYYHSILLTFRPFLVTGDLAGSQQKQGAMWLREACRQAKDAAQDTLVFIDNDLATTGSCKVRFLRCLTIVIPEDSDSFGWSNATESGVFRWTCLSHVHMHVSEILPWETESNLAIHTAEMSRLLFSSMCADPSPGLEIHSLFHRIELRRAAIRQPVSIISQFQCHSLVGILAKFNVYRWHPAKHAYNLEYIHKGLHCLDTMVNAEPILNARTSIRRMIGAVEQTIASRSRNHGDNNTSVGAGVATTTTPSRPATNATNQQSFTSTSESRNTTNPQACSDTTFTSAANDFLYLSDRAQTQHGTAGLHPQALSQALLDPATSSSTFDPNATMMGGGDPMSLLDFDVLTTDLYSFFPIQTDRGV